MSRTIKFRAKNKQGEWIYGNYCKLTQYDGVYIIPEDMGGVIVEVEDFKVDPETVGQLTCLRDKKGNEIYEGDIIKVGDEKEKIEVRYVRGVFAFLWNGDLDDEFPCNAPTHEWAEVVGNIHDNPKLIKRR